jgi:ABC-type sugar transport system permease subunit
MFLPWAVPAVVTAYAWRFLFDTSGPINGLIAQFQLADDYIYFFNDARIALPALILVVIWSGTPFWTMNFLAGMQAIPSEQYEAAEIDGASTFQRFRYITIPSLRPVILVTTLLSTIWTSANLTQILVLTGGGPTYSTTTLPLLAYLVAIPGHELGAGAAISMMMMPAYTILVFFLTRQMLRQE